MDQTVNRQWLLASRPTGMVAETDFSYAETAVPAVTDGAMLVRNLCVSFDPAMRGWMTEDPGYAPPIPVGEVMRASAIGQVVDSRHPAFEKGDIVSGQFGWQDYALSSGGDNAFVQKIAVAHPLPRYLGVLGGTGLTAYFGLLDVGQPKEGETVVISGAAGATGSVAAQIAKLEGCRVVGIAGGPTKCGWLTDELGLDAAIDYKNENLDERLGALCPDRIDVYFDNVGGAMLETVLGHMSVWGRVALCGMISGYNAAAPVPGPRNLVLLITRRIKMNGFLILDYVHRFKEGRRQLSAWLATGKLKAREDVQEGFENIPKTFLRLFQGENIGKQVLRIAEPPLEIPKKAPV